VKINIHKFPKMYLLSWQLVTKNDSLMLRETPWK
jgi:hypothetical protein